MIPGAFTGLRIVISNYPIFGEKAISGCASRAFRSWGFLRTAVALAMPWRIAKKD
jgi:hypothetical protein